MTPFGGKESIREHLAALNNMPGMLIFASVKMTKCDFLKRIFPKERSKDFLLRVIEYFIEFRKDFKEDC